MNWTWIEFDVSGPIRSASFERFIPVYGSLPLFAKRPLGSSLNPVTVYLWITGAVFASCWLNPLSAQDQQAALRQSQKAFSLEIRPVLQNACGDCHWGEGSDAGLDLEPYENLQQILDDRAEWQKILQRVSKKQMPPEDADPLSEDQHQKVVAWIDQLINNLDCSNTSPGRMTIRRLNATEYRNTIRDLTGIEFEAAKDFPGDDVGYGFDNIGDVLSLPPILMEKYLEAADSILQQAITDVSALKLDRTLYGSEFDPVRGSRHIGDDHAMSTRGTLSKRLSFPSKGTYRVVVEAYGDHAGDDWPKLELTADGQQNQVAEVESRKRKPSTHEFKIRVRQPGEKRVEVSFTNDYYDPDFPLRTARDRNLYIGYVKIIGPVNQRIKLSPSHRKVVTDSPSETRTRDEAALKVIYDFASRAYRRRVTKDEVHRLKRLFDLAITDGDSYEEALRFTLQAVLVSPNFLFKVELPPPADGKSYPLDSFELATSLSYYLWSSMPDDDLFRAAAKNRLSDPDEYRNQVRRMLASPKAYSLVENFAEQWLQLRVLSEFQPDPELFPGCDEKLLKDMATETKLLFADILRRDASILEMLDSDHTFLNRRLAKHYGIQGVSGASFSKVSLEGTRRGGILTHGSILTLTSNPDRTSPVKRGKWIMENLLGEEPPPPAPEAMPLESQEQLGGTVRERMEQHRRDPNCASCHKKMDQLGFALENFDAVGRWRELDGKSPIDASAKLPDGIQFEGAGGLQAALVEKMQRQFLTCLTEKMLIYSLGRGLTYSDQCAVDAIIEHAAKNEYRISEFILAVAESEPFMRRSLRSQGE